MSIGKKLTLSAGAMLIAVLGIVLSSLYSLESVGSELDRATGEIARKLALTGNIKAAANGMRTGQRGILLNALEKDTRGLQNTRKDYSARHQKVTDLMWQLRPLLVTGQGRAAADALEATVNQHVASFEQISRLCDAGKVEEAEKVYREHGAPAGAAMETTASSLMTFEIELMQQSAAAGRRKKVQAVWTAALMSIFALATMGALVWVQRDICVRLLGLAVQLGQGADQISGATGQLSSASQSLAQGQHIKALDELGGLDVLGSPKTDNQYHAGWAWAGSTPYKGTKLLASHLGGTRNPLVIQWPAKIKPDAKPRPQFHHCNDIVPTIYEVVGITPPLEVNGIPQDPIDGVSFAYTFGDPTAKGRMLTQYFEIMGSRAIYHDGWMASAFGPRIPVGGRFAPGDSRVDTGQ